MMKKILVIVIIITSLYQLYCNFCKESDVIPKTKKEESKEVDNDEVEEDKKFVDKDGVDNNTEVLTYGKPHTIKQDE